jgi:Protein of unknown function (DUF3662)/FHA domain
MGINAFERRLERMVDGVFARAFRSSLRPIEIGRKLVREIDDHRSVDVKGRVIVPNQFTVTLSHDDLEQFADIHEALVRELCDAAREYARDEGYTFMGPVSVELVEAVTQKSGRFKIEGRMVEATSMAGAGSIVLPTGDRIVLGAETLTIGRLPSCDIPVPDPNVSRKHAEIRPSGAGYVVVDLGSTNGTRVNGATINERKLTDGDVIAVGTTRLRFEAS